MSTNKEATRDWTPPAGEFRPSQLGACERYAWEQLNLTQAEKDAQEAESSIGREVMLWSGHAAEERWIELANERENRLLVHGVTLTNGYGGTCHPDAVSWANRELYEIKFTGFKTPAPYHVAQLSWYLLRIAEETGREDWTGYVVLLDKYGKDPSIHEVPFPDPEFRAELLRRAEAHTGPEAPKGMCTTRQQALTSAKYYDKEGKVGPRTEIACPHADRCFPNTDDFGV